MPEFGFITANVIRNILDDEYRDIVALVEDAYLMHADHRTVNPHSLFLRFPDRPGNRIIALPASLNDSSPIDGIKWISSVPSNHDRGLPRASAVLILNDPETGFPLACLESSVISAVRTAASAALAAERVAGARDRRSSSVAYIGTGLIAEQIHRFLTGTGWTFDRIYGHDAEPGAVARFSERIGRAVTDRTDPEAAIRAAELLVFATTTGAPYVHNPEWFSHNPLVLNISLRDLSPEVILASANIVDDVDHCLRHETSPHLAEQRSGDRSFVTGVLSDVINGLRLPANRPVVFSPFGLGILDLAVARHVHRRARSAGQVHTITGFFPTVPAGAAND